MERLTWTMLLGLALAGCDDDDDGGESGPVAAGNEAAAPPQLTAWPVEDFGSIQSVGPMGWIQSGHTLPSDSITFMLDNPSGLSVRAPAAGTVARIGAAEIEIQIRDGFSYILGGVARITAKEGQTLAAGDFVGKTDARELRLWILNRSVQREFANPSRYDARTLHADSWLDHFDSELRSALAPLVQGSESEIDFDVAGTLMGNWFLEGTAGDCSPRSRLAFMHTMTNPAHIRVSIGGAKLDYSGLYDVDYSNAVSPALLSKGMGATYVLTQGGEAKAKMIVQMLDDDSIEVTVTGLYPLAMIAEVMVLSDSAPLIPLPVYRR